MRMILVKTTGSVDAIVSGRVAIARFASAILLLICEKLNPLYVRLLACEFCTGVPIGICAGGGDGVGDFALWTCGIALITTTRPGVGAGVGLVAWANVEITEPVDINRPRQMLFFIIIKFERRTGSN